MRGDDLDLVLALGSESVVDVHRDRPQLHRLREREQRERVGATRARDDDRPSHTFEPDETLGERVQRG